MIDAVKQRFGEPNEVSRGENGIWKIVMRL
jgi:hypothetical protein